MNSGSGPSRDDLVAALHDVLALVSMDRLSGVGPVAGVPGTWSARPDGLPGARVMLGPGEQVLVDGVPTTGVTDLDATDPNIPGAGRVTIPGRGTLVIWLMEDAGAGETWVGLTTDSAPRLRSFQGFSGYPFAAEWAVPVVFTAATAADDVSVTRHFGTGDEEHEMRRAGWLDATIDGEHYRLSVDRGPGNTYVTFRDAGSGVESYEAGRVVRLPADPRDVTELDFNQAAVLPCALNPLMPCPLPPPGNVLRAHVRAGQRHALFDAPS